MMVGAHNILGGDLDELSAMLSEGPIVAPDLTGSGGQAPVVLAEHKLESERDYRGALQRWFEHTQPGGYLVVTVAGTETDHSSGQPCSNKVEASPYTSQLLLERIEESLDEGTYRVAHLSQRKLKNAECQRESSSKVPKATEIVIALEKIVAAQPGSAAPEPTVLDRDFSARRTRIETIQTGDVDRVLILKLDHLGDFIMSLPALERARALFYDSHITLVVGSWNESLARESGFADTVLVFDAFPRNSSEEKVDLVGKTALFAQTIRGPFDLAIDLRTDPDTRFYLQHVEAAARAGLGTRAQFPYLDVFLPIDVTRHEPETAREDVLQPHQFFAQPFCTRSHFRIYCSPENVTDKFGAVIWGPYRRLRPGRYFFEPFLEFDSPAEGLLLIDVALNMERKVAKAISASSTLRIAFDVEQSAAEFEFRIHEPHDGRPIGFNFYGGRLVREGADSVLHQSEYQVLLLELIAMRLMEHGLRRELRGLL